MTKQKFLNDLYHSYVSDVLGCADIILEENRFKVLPIDSHIFNVARNLRKRPCFRNIQFLAKFVCCVLQDYPVAYDAITMSPKVSPYWLSFILVFTNYYPSYECKENNSK